MLRSRRVVFSLAGGTSVVLLASLFMGFGGGGPAQPQSQTAKVLRRGTPATNQEISQPTAEELDDAATPIVDLNDPTPVSSERALKNAHWDKHDFVRAELDPRAAAVVIDHWEGQSLSDLPTDKSDLVLEGQVTEAAAFLSNDKGDVYSEFTVRVTEVLKTTADFEINRGDLIVTERRGGRVRYPDGRIIRYGFVGQGSPMKGKKYLFFLSKTEHGNYKILTGYELQSNKVFALDGSRINHRGLGRWSFDKHNDEEYRGFRAMVDKAIKSPPSPAQNRRVGP
jgi:hypothetical protein